MCVYIGYYINLKLFSLHKPPPSTNPLPPPRKKERENMETII